MDQLRESLERSRQSMVWDETGLKGKYFIAFRYAAPNAPVDADVDAPPLDAALQENLGLKLEKRKGPVQFVVIDRMEKTPIENP